MSGAVVSSRLPDIAWIVPAHNEASTVAAVVRAIVAADLGPVLVVADRCHDATGVEAHRAGAAVLVVDVGDKGSAMWWGLGCTDSDRVGFIDADLIGLRPEHLHQLASVPGAMVIGLSTWRVPGFASIAGQRVLPRAIARAADLAGAGYRAEMELAAVAEFRGVPIVEVPLPGLQHPTRIGLERAVSRWSGVLAGHRNYRRAVALHRPVAGRQPPYSARAPR
jgi:hypothetical protein